MVTTFIVVLVVSGALVVGALWGVYGKIPDWLDGFLVALAGGALLLSVTSELIAPSIERGSLVIAGIFVSLGAVVFSGANHLIRKRWGTDSGGGLLAAITLDGIPENLALGVALIGAGAPQVAALAGSILLSNLPEAAGGAREMAGNKRSKGRILSLWAATAVLLSAAAIAGNLLLEKASDNHLAAIRCFAAGAVIASLALTVFPKAYREERDLAGIATALGAILAFVLGSLGG